MTLAMFMASDPQKVDVQGAAPAAVRVSDDVRHGRRIFHDKMRQGHQGVFRYTSLAASGRGIALITEVILIVLIGPHPALSLGLKGMAMQTLASLQGQWAVRALIVLVGSRRIL